MRALAIVAILLVAPPRARADGARLYEQLCAACHGAAGDGRGPAAPYLWPPPRAFVGGQYAWRVGPSDSDDDVATAIRYGAPGTAMPAFGDALSAAQLDELAAVVKALASSGNGGRARAITSSAPPDPARGAALWSSAGCTACHGARGDGVGAVGAEFDLTVIHRPRGPEPGALRAAVLRAIAFGAGTAMPSYAGALPDEALVALADHVLTLQRRARTDAISARAVEADRAAPLAVATWPGPPSDEAAQIFGAAIPPQGPPPASLAPAEASLSARQCARCHAKQYREWETSLHRASLSPGFRAETEEGAAGEPTGNRAACMRCHAPLAEQATDATLAAEGATCAGCHVRNWTRRGPPDLAPSLARLPSYPFAPLALYERSDFCLPCHQLPPRDAVAGKPLLDTYVEWLASPYQPRGVQCQQCHMPNREHAALGVHDPHTFRQGIRLDARAHRGPDGAITVRAAVTNIGAGHLLPTTPTPAAWLTLELVDARGIAITGARDAVRIGRDVWFDGAWHERSDTRIAPGDTLSMARAWLAPRATAARVTLEVHPDEYYEHLYERRLAEPGLAAPQRALFEQALARARASHYIAEQRAVALSSAR